MIVTGPRSGHGLALLLGWTGGHLRHVMKHASLWHRVGMRTAGCEMSVDKTFLPRERTGISAVVSQLLEVIEGERSSSRPRLIVPHMFSNGGVLLMLSLLDAAHEAGVPLHFDGAVFDSSPSRSVHPLAVPFVIGTGGGTVAERAALTAHHLPHALAATLRSPVSGIAPPLGLFPNLRDPGANPPRKAELFIYSRADRLIPAGAVQEFAEARRTLGVAVSTCEMDGTAHCMHFRGHPQRYQDAVAAFMRELLGERAPPDGVESFDPAKYRLNFGSKLSADPAMW